MAEARQRLKRSGSKTVRQLPRAAVAEIFARFAAREPEPKGELAYTSPFTLLVAVVLSAQTTDAGVNRATPALFAKAATPQKMIALGEERIIELIRTIGLFRTKAHNLVALSQKLVADFGAEVPQTRDELMTLPGVGRKTANVVLNTAFGAPTIGVDTHVFRVANRTGIAPAPDALSVEEKLERVVPDQYKRHAHHWLILHGRYICIARRPKCPQCLIADICRYPEKTPPAPETA